MKINEKILIEILKENDPEVDTEFRKGSTFYATATLEVDEDCYNMESLSQEEKDYLIGKRISASGYWSDDYGLDLYDAWVEEKTLTHVPEEVKIIPAHDIIIWSKVNETI